MSKTALAALWPCISSSSVIVFMFRVPTITFTPAATARHHLLVAAGAEVTQGGDVPYQHFEGPQYRDLHLTDQVKAENTTIMCCVSRNLDQKLELEL